MNLRIAVKIFENTVWGKPCLKRASKQDLSCGQLKS